MATILSKGRWVHIVSTSLVHVQDLNLVVIVSTVAMALLLAINS